MYQILVYSAKDEKVPLNEWLDTLDPQNRYRIIMRIERLKLGNFSNCKSIADGVSEVKIDFGPGYRIYYGTIEKTIIILLYGGTKRTQQKDIERAKQYFHKYKESTKKYGYKMGPIFN